MPSICACIQHSKQLDLQSHTCEHKYGSNRQQDESNQGDDTPEEDLKLLGAQFAPQIIHECVDLT